MATSYSSDSDVPVFWYILAGLFAAYVTIYYQADLITTVFFGLAIANFFWGMSDLLPEEMPSDNRVFVVIKLTVALAMLLGIIAYNKGPLALR